MLLIGFIANNITQIDGLKNDVESLNYDSKRVDLLADALGYEFNNDVQVTETEPHYQKKNDDGTYCEGYRCYKTTQTNENTFVTEPSGDKSTIKRGGIYIGGEKR